MSSQKLSRTCWSATRPGSRQQEGTAMTDRLLENWGAAVRAKNLEGAVAHHTDDVVMFDVPLPLQSRGMEDL
jgi:ketosteroid isomerase-like protein